jgi:hypothetical protein
MRVIARNTLVDFWSKHPEAKVALDIHTLDTALIMAADTISGYIQGLLNRVKFKQTAYALVRGSWKAALARFLSEAIGEHPADTEDSRPLAA